MVQIVKTIQQVRETVKAWKKAGLQVGLVPTMGYLHEGHQSLMAQAKAENDRVVTSIFVNPMQFGPTEDLASYPRDLDKDSLLCQQVGVDLIFHPEAEEMYSANFCSFVDMTGLTEELCGRSRPIHFRGVCTVVSKLFNIVQPDRAYFGQKDAQQLAVIRQMVNDLNINVQVVGCPIIREHDGLAKSSRNSYLDAEQRQAALCLYRAIQLGRKLMQQGEKQCAVIISQMENCILQEPMAKIDYISIVDASKLTPVERIDAPVLCAMAIYIGKTRLIDNFVFDL
ncbi:pantoate--beta-alanine ligase [Limnobaculum zhutongyuii]|uniref:Pantothenate synthetase n=1 Tax=Limnobaculum zhutongyuii TaxID=2498113 RepID=A0A411WJF3_9GAMM|nr:pantoate--beta-alanine ligase [Limnobaculum zhutongyuii]QBH96300.1 pantoate--beta-alanine ligase [Limnobaculum zhutongyuii]TQS87111.1 pantoate--beta-alanine ligase [Limnobaculum zhutongyuii]